MTNFICPHCQNSNQNHLLFLGLNADAPEAARLPIVQCHGCELVFTDPHAIPHGEELYFEGYYGEAKSESGVNKLAIGMFQKERQLLSLPTRRPLRVLDVGCGDGSYLRHLPLQVERFGYEPSAAGQKSLAAHGISYFDIYSPAQTARFDVITLWQSLEHVEKPDLLLQAVKGILADGGHLFVSVPNFESLQARLFGPRWFHLDPTRHLFHYTPKTLKAVLTRNGFTPTHMTTRSLEYGVFGWWQSLFNLLPLDFNMGFKILKARKRYEMTFSTRLALLAYAVLGIPMALVASVCVVIETLIGRGGVIHLTVESRKHHAN